ncbi:MAG: MBL fold metallo-hydrolase [Dethiosulfovibrio peptidovorans]|nr:MAG: MBL fold metallo-hydrolase [Dethiosulfovibrio peptidovorans]
MEWKRFPLGLLWTNGYLLWGQDKVGFFVDPGGDPREVVQWIEEREISLYAVVLTHGHADHIAGAAALSSRFGSQVWIHPEDEEMLSRGDKNLSIQLGADCPPVEATGYLKDGVALSVGTLMLSVIHTPGHTRGSCCILVRDGDQKLLLAGDTLFARSIGRTDLPGSVPQFMEASLARLAVLNSDLLVLPGHGPETTIGIEKRENPFLS